MVLAKQLLLPELLFQWVILLHISLSNVVVIGVKSMPVESFNADIGTVAGLISKNGLMTMKIQKKLSNYGSI